MQTNAVGGDVGFLDWKHRAFLHEVSAKTISVAPALFRLRKPTYQNYG
jgi:hypothetical protein